MLLVLYLQKYNLSPPCIFTQVSWTPDGNIDFYSADVVTATDFYPGGMLMPGRKYAATGKYRYGFNGKENDNDVKGEGNLQDYGMRIYDPRLGRFLSVDPLSDSYPWNSVYSYAEGDPINYIDLDGAETPTQSAQSTRSRTIPVVTITVDPKLLDGSSGGKIGGGSGTQLFTNGRINSANYAAPQFSYISQEELEALVPNYGYCTLNPDKKSVTITNANGNTWIQSIVKEPKPIKQITWVDRVAYRAYLNAVSAFNYPTWNQSIQSYETITTDPATLSDDYLHDVNRRLLNGSATHQDRLYAEEVARRRANGTVVDPQKVEFIQGTGEKAKKVVTDLPKGFKKTNMVSHGQAVYSNGKLWITPDTDGHNGGVWKMFDKEKNVGSTDKDKRLGTYNQNLIRIGD